MRIDSLVRSIGRLALIALAPALALMACHGRDAVGGMPASDPAEHAQPRDRVTTVRLSSQVEALEPGTSALRTLVARHDGYVQSSTSSEHRAGFVLRVPTSRLESFRDGVRGLGELQREEEQVEDVTDQRGDRVARLRNARREEERLLGLMSERAESLSDVIAIEERLGVVRGRVEQLEAEERALARRVAHAEVHVDLSLRPTAFWEEPAATLSSATAFGVDLATAATVGGAALVAGAGPTAILFALVVAVLLFGLRGLARRRAQA